MMVLFYLKTFKFDILMSKQHFPQLVSEKAISAKSRIDLAIHHCINLPVGCSVDYFVLS